VSERPSTSRSGGDDDDDQDDQGDNDIKESFRVSLLGVAQGERLAQDLLRYMG